MTLGEYNLVSGLIRFYFSLQLQKRMLSKREAEGGGGERERRESRVGVWLRRWELAALKHKER